MATTPSLKSMLVSSKATEVEYPGLSGFMVNLSFLSRETLANIRKKSTKTTWKNRASVEELNEDLFLKLYSAAAIKGWKGLKLSYLEQLAPVDMSGQDLNSEMPFTDDDALDLMKASVNFDAFVSETVTDLTNFTTASKSN